MNLIRTVENWMRGEECFVFEAGYYAGRGPTQSDLNSRILEKFYVGIKNDFSQEAATNFVRLVAGLKDLSASAFIIAFEAFARSGFKSTKIQQRSEDRDSASSRLQAFAVVAVALFGRRVDNDDVEKLSNEIKREFIDAHRLEVA